MHRFTRIDTVRQNIRAQRQLGRTIGLVPTMGNLHAGHLQLVREARQHCDYVVCTIFVNPMQFGENEDLDAYPRTLQADIELLESYQCDCLFHPEVEEIYPPGYSSQTVVSVPDLGTDHCGKSRPGHFDGVTTVVNKLVNICQPDHAFFGLKDYQQYLIIRKMVTDLQIPIQVFGVQTQREQSGLAMSSRNIYLDSQQRKQAPLLYQTLARTAEQLKAGNRAFDALEQSAKQQLQAAGARPDYFSICHATTLQRATGQDSELVILAAVFLGKSRLIDNILVSLA